MSFVLHCIRAVVSCSSRIAPFQHTEPLRSASACGHTEEVIYYMAPAAATQFHSGAVLYGDYNGRMQPLRRMYFSMTSRCLVADHPESVQEEVESHFCPNCNSLCTTPEAQAHGIRCLQCFECPCCGNVLTPIIVSLEPSPGRVQKYALQCLHCQWSSEEIGLVAQERAALIEEALARDREEQDRDTKLVRGLLTEAKKLEGDACGVMGVGGARASVGFASLGEGDLPSFAIGPADSTVPWKVANLEDAVAAKVEAVAAASRAVAAVRPTRPPRARSSEGPKSAWSVGEDSDGPDAALWTSTRQHQQGAVTRRTQLDTPAPRGLYEPEWPRRVRLRTRLGKRCRKDLEAGRAGILIKATFNPLEGDSSGAKKGGKWFKKDCSAALLVPQISIACKPTRPLKGGQQSLILRIANPQDTVVRIRFADDAVSEGHVGNVSNDSELAREDSLHGHSCGVVAGLATSEQGEGVPAAASQVAVTPQGWEQDEWVRLDGREDELLRQPGERHRCPEGTLRLVDGDEDSSHENASCSVLHRQGDVAWVQLSLDKASSERVAEAAAAAPLAEVTMAVRFSMVMRDGEEGDAGENDVRVPIMVCVPLPAYRR